MNKKITMLYPSNLLENIDKYKLKKGFTTRTQVIIYLIQNALTTKENNILYNDNKILKVIEKDKKKVLVSICEGKMIWINTNSLELFEKQLKELIDNFKN
jgi:metal-responsive CopG/Arc/MetJ family transcriptional regulator